MKLLYLLKNNIFFLVITITIGASIFYTYNVIIFHQALSSPFNKYTIKSGRKVKVIKILDSDEVLVESKKLKLIVRILGIKSYDPTIQDLYLQDIAQLAYKFLDKELLNSNVKLIFTEFKKDKKNRLLSYIYKGKMDIGAEMVKNGYSLVYTLFPFDRMENYLKIENRAIKDRKGIWSNKNASRRSFSLKNLWRRERGIH